MPVEKDAVASGRAVESRDEGMGQREERPVHGGAGNESQSLSRSTRLSPDEVSLAPERRRKKRRRHRSRRRRIALRVLACACAVLLIGAVGAFAFWRHMVDEGRRSFNEVAELAASQGTVEFEGARYRLKDNLVTLCFIGYDETGGEAGKGGQSDAVMVAAIDTSDGSINVISVPRDSMVTVDAYSNGRYAGQTTEQLCLQYSYGTDDEMSSELTVSTVSRLLYGIGMTHYLTLDMSGIAPLNDALGGVRLTALETIPETGIAEGSEVHLMGREAERYVRYRGGDESSSLRRQQRQMQYIQAFAAQAFEVAKGNPGVLLDLFNLAQAYTTTNMGLEQFSYLVDTVLAHGAASIEVTSLAGEMRTGTTFAEFYLDEDALHRTVLETFYEPVE